MQLAASVERAVAEQRLVPGERLPTVRELAAQLGVSPTTVSAAYRELARRGIVSAEGRRGTRVRPRPPLTARIFAETPAGARDLAVGLPDPALLPALGHVLARAAAGPAMPVRSDQMDDEQLVAEARRRFAADGIEARGVAVVGGAMDGIERVFGAELRPGDAVAVEDPGFSPVYDLLAALGLEPRPVALDDRGLLPDSLAAALATGVRALVLTPRAQNPTGAALDDERAGELARLLNEHPGVLVIEDDHAGPVAGAPAATLCRSPRERWAVVRSVSKSLGPDLRLALMAADPTTLARVQGRQLLGAGWVSQILQRAVVRLWEDPDVERLVARAGRTYAERRRALLAALEDVGIAARGASGLNVWVPVRDELVVTQALLEAGWAVAPGERYRIAAEPAIRVTTATLEPGEAPALAAEIARAGAGGRRVRAY